ncbi:MAG: GLUG motif-containing protein, partial [Intestinibacter sp.]
MGKNFQKNGETLNKIIAVMISAVMTVSMCPLSAFADSEDLSQAVSGSSLILTNTGSTEWVNSTDENGRTIISTKANGAVSLKVKGPGWLIFDWKVDNTSWQTKMIINKAGSQVSSTSLNSSSYTSWQTSVQKIEDTEETELQITYTDSGSNGNSLYLDNIRFVTEATAIATPKVTPENGGTVSISAEKCDPGSSVTYQATPSEGYVFLGWKHNESDESYIKKNSYDTVPAGASYQVTIYDEAPSLIACFSKPFDGIGSQENPYLIKTKEDLNELAELVNNGNEMEGVYFSLASDITLDDSFVGITNYFSGVFDGKGHKISGLTGETYGLFKKINNKNAVIKNLTVDGNVVAQQGTGSSDKGSALLVGKLNKGTIQNCVVTGTIDGNEKSSVGGIVGEIGTDSVVTGCYSEATITGGADSIGGLIGLVSGYNSTVNYNFAKGNVTGDRYVGGLIGKVTSTYQNGVTDCYATGDVTGREQVGGAIGYTQSSKLERLYTTGNVVATGETTNSIAGGVVGKADSNSTQGYINDCIALNKSVEAKTTGRVIGLSEEATQWSKAYILANNHAYVGINSTVEGLADNKEGQDVTLEALKGSTVIAPFYAWSTDVWTIEAGKLPLLKAISADAQSDKLPSYSGEEEPSEEEQGLNELAKALWKDQNQTIIKLDSATNMKSANGDEILVHGVSSTYPEPIYAGGIVAQTTNTKAEEGQETSEATVTLKFKGEGKLLFDYMALTSYGGDKLQIEIDGAERQDVNTKTFNLYTDWETVAYDITGDTEHTVTIIYSRTKWASETNLGYLLDNVRFVGKDFEGSKINVSMSDEADKAGCQVTSDKELTGIGVNTEVTLKAEPSEGWVFNGWKNLASDSSYISTDSEYSTTIYDEGMSIYAEFTKPFEGLGTKENPYQINSLDDLKKLSKVVNEGTTFAGYYFVQNVDIDMSGLNWTPIGEREKTFDGIYNGNDKTISNMTSEQYDCAGLFGFTGKGSSISNLKFKDVKLTTTITNESFSNKSQVGVVAGNCYGRITDCYVENAEIKGLVNVGGIVGYHSTQENSEIINCGVKNATVVATGNWDNAYVGGIAGNATGIPITNCYFTGSVTGYGRYVAGIVSDSYADITNCYVKADITSIASESSNIDANSVGGIASGYRAGTMSNCYVVGNIT